MHITFVTDVGETYNLEIDPNMEMENIMALLEAEVSVATIATCLSLGGRTIWPVDAGANADRRLTVWDSRSRTKYFV